MAPVSAEMRWSGKGAMPGVPSARVISHGRRQTLEETFNSISRDLTSGALLGGRSFGAPELRSGLFGDCHCFQLRFLQLTV
eukprot:11972626-Karenia_brevis.AAC.1